MPTEIEYIILNIGTVHWVFCVDSVHSKRQTVGGFSSSFICSKHN